MSRRLDFHELADREFDEAIQYYEFESRGLGAAFLDELERCLDRIEKHPEAGKMLAASVRRRLLRRFPYALLYAVKADGIRVLAVMNLKRRPTHWVGRE